MQIRSVSNWHILFCPVVQWYTPHVTFILMMSVGASDVNEDINPLYTFALIVQHQVCRQGKSLATVVAQTAMPVSYN